MSDKPDNRYVLRQDAPGSWTVLDTHIPATRENRVIYRVSENRAKQIADHLNRVVLDRQQATS